MKSNFLIMSPFHQNIVYRVFIVSKESSDGVHISIKIATCDTVKLFCKQNSNIEYSFQANVAARGYKVYKNITWEETKCGDKVLNDLETDEKATEIDPYCCLIKTMVGRPQQLKTVGHIPEKFPDMFISS